jgi:glutaredoxin
MQRYTVNGCRCTDCKFAKMLYRNKEIEYREVVEAPEGWRRGIPPSPIV